MTDTPSVLREAAAEHGFGVVGVTTAEPLEEARVRLEAWWAAGCGADMTWMGRDPPQRADPRTLLADVRSVVTVAVNHWSPAAPAALAGPVGHIARYAWGRDYHDVVIPRLRALGASLADRLGGGVRARAACDHSPLLERAAAARAGLGFIGKHTGLILPRAGSWFLLGEVLLDADLEPTAPEGPGHCGTCRTCLDVCPTGALVEPYVLDARRCVSYLTIEHRGPIPHALRPGLGAWVFGCDDCQTACPFTRYAEPTTWREFAPEEGAGSHVDFLEVLSMRTDETFQSRYADTPLLRPRRRGLLRNAAVAARNAEASHAVPALEACVREDPEPLVRGHALWALFGLAPDRARALAERARAGDPDGFVQEEARRGLEQR